ncbi:MAG: YcxB family protein [Alphaproteobacteria bacterium]|nr:YcxB family protein [Alphaproteobacteria bacterium]
MADDAIEVEFELTVDDLVAFNRTVANDNKSLPIGLSFAQFRGPIIVAFLLIAMCFVAPPRGVIFVQFLSGFLTCGLFIACMVFVLRGRSLRLCFKKMLVSENYSKRKVIINSAFAKEITRYSEYQIHWQGIERVQKAADFVFLYVTGMNAFIIPKRAFADEAAFERFYQACLEYWNAAKEREPAAEGAA